MLNSFTGPKPEHVSPEQVQEARRYNLLRLLPSDIRLKSIGLGKYMVNCFWHEDPNASLSLRKCDDGQWRYHCFGCGQDGDPIQYLIKQKGHSFVQAVQELTDAAKNAPRQPREVCRYDYTDEQGKLLYQVIRYDPKGFRQCRPDPDGAGCIWNLQGVRRVLYRLPRIKALSGTTFHDDSAPPAIWYVEGEKDVDTLVSHGLFATTHAGGAQSWRDELLQQIPKGFRIILCPDMDDPGKQLMRRIWNAAQNDSRDVNFVLLNKGKDVSEFFELGGTVAELEGLIT